MLRSGIPLEGSLAQLSKNMRGRALKEELEKLGAKLQEGLPFGAALETSALPATYVQLLKAGVESQNLASVLTLVADYYGKLHAISTRLRGLMVYPMIILICSLGLSILLTGTYWMAYHELAEPLSNSPVQAGVPELIFWLPSFLFCFLIVTLGFAFKSSRVRNWLRWHLPGIKDASLAQSASTLSILLASGTHLGTSLKLAEQTEGSSPGSKDLKLWRENLEEGKSRFPEIAQRSRVYPPLFIWLVAQCGEDLASGFARAAEIYGERAQSRTDMLLYAALPMAVIVLGGLILGQTVSLVALLSHILDGLG